MEHITKVFPLKSDSLTIIIAVINFILQTADLQHQRKKARSEKSERRQKRPLWEDTYFIHQTLKNQLNKQKN